MRLFQKLGTWLPGIQLLLRYDGQHLRPDLLSALVVTLVIIPSVIAYADLAHAPASAGLFAAVGGMIIFALFTSSRHVIVGPDAAIALLVGAAVWPLAGGDPVKALALSTWLALITGVLLIVAARLRLGVAADFLSSPVMQGFLNGAAVVIIGSQIGKLCGISLTQDNTLLRFYEWATRLAEVHNMTLITGLVSLILLIAARLWLPKVPGTVLVFVVALIAGRLLDFAALHMQVIGAVELRLPDAVPSALSLTDFTKLVTAAIGLTFLIFPEGVLLARAVANRRRYRIDPDRELVALGAANLAAGVLHSFAVGASQTRTLLNDATGGRSQMVSFLAAGLLVVFIVFLGNWIATLPSVAIAAILVFIGVTLIDIAAVKKLYQLHTQSGWISLLTTVAVIGIGVLPGILLGIILSLVSLLSQIVRPQDALLGRVEGSGTLHDIGDDAQAQTLPGLVVYRFYGPVIFANVRYFLERLEYFIGREHHPVRQVIIDARAIPTIDVTAAEQLEPYFMDLHERGIEVVLVKAHLPLRQALKKFRDAAGTPRLTRYYSQLADAVAAFETGQAKTE